MLMVLTKGGSAIALPENAATEVDKTALAIWRAKGRGQREMLDDLFLRLNVPSPSAADAQRMREAPPEPGSWQIIWADVVPDRELASDVLVSRAVVWQMVELALDGLTDEEADDRTRSSPQ
jgi:hypothetical protein